MGINHRELQEIFSRVEGEVQAGQIIVENNYGRQEHDVAHTSGKKCLLGCSSRRWLSVPESYQEIGAQTHQLPEYEELKDIIGINQAQHGSSEECCFSKVPVSTRITVHVSIGIGVDQHNHKCDHEKHH